MNHMKKRTVPLRQVHMDFHTSEDIPDVGSKFDPELFAETLSQADVESVTCFARCHHGWLYYPSKTHPQLIHPNLQYPRLLQDQIAACRRRGIRVPVYTTVQWDGLTSSLHPEWCVMTEEGSLRGAEPFEPGFYTYLCVNTGYRDFLYAHIDDLFEQIEPEGIFFDIVQEVACSCISCRRDMKSQGLNPAVQEQRQAFAHRMISEFKQEMTAYVHQHNPEAGVFYNGSHVDPSIRDCLEGYTHLEVESLPSGSWGYDHYPMTARYARTLALPHMGMTGKFHTYWGDFHSYKNRAALEYECFHMLALGGSISVGDQLHPSGEIDPETYRNIGSVFSRVRELEPWCMDVEHVSEIGVLNLEQWYKKETSESMAGVSRMLRELSMQFDIIDSESDFTQYRLIVLPDYVPAAPHLIDKLEQYLSSGGKLLASYTSGFDDSPSAPLHGALGVRRTDPQVFDDLGNPREGEISFTNEFADYFLPEKHRYAALPRRELGMYTAGVSVQAFDDAEVSAYAVKPYFYRTWRHYCSHQQAPSSGMQTGPAAVRTKNTGYIAFPVFAVYRRRAPRWMKQVVEEELRNLLGDVTLAHTGPSGLSVNLTVQRSAQRLMIHLLYYVPERRCTQFDVIEDVIPLHDIELTLNLQLLLPGRKVSSCLLVPEMERLSFHDHENRITLTIPKIAGYQVVEVKYA